jgi:hypothetical protein
MDYRSRQDLAKSSIVISGTGKSSRGWTGFDGNAVCTDDDVVGSREKTSLCQQEPAQRHHWRQQDGKEKEAKEAQPTLSPGNANDEAQN